MKVTIAGIKPLDFSKFPPLWEDDSAFPDWALWRERSGWVTARTYEYRQMAVLK